jgi:hypothetical protein
MSVRHASRAAEGSTLTFPLTPGHSPDRGASILTGRAGQIVINDPLDVPSGCYCPNCAPHERCGQLRTSSGGRLCVRSTSQGRPAVTERCSVSWRRVRRPPTNRAATATRRRQMTLCPMADTAWQERLACHGIPDWPGIDLMPTWCRLCARCVQARVRRQRRPDALPPLLSCASSAVRNRLRRVGGAPTSGGVAAFSATPPACLLRSSGSAPEDACAHSARSPSHQRCHYLERPMGVVALDVIAQVLGEGLDRPNSSPSLKWLHGLSPMETGRGRGHAPPPFSRLLDCSSYRPGENGWSQVQARRNRRWLAVARPLGVVRIPALGPHGRGAGVASRHT